MSEKFVALKSYLDRYEALGMALSLISFDSDTYAPDGAYELTSKAASILGKEAFDILTSPEVKALCADLVKEELPFKEKRIVELTIKNLKKLESIPGEEYQERILLGKKAQRVWLEAKQKNDYTLFSPYLEKLIAMEKKFATYRCQGQQNLYDVLLDDYEPGMTEADYDRFFNEVKVGIVPLIKKIAKLDVKPAAFLTQSYDLEVQRQFNKALANYIGFDFNRGRMSETEHPYTTNLHSYDVRFTNHYYENQLDSAIFSTIHEGGHGIYEQQMADEVTMSCLSYVSSGLHESQSRFMENCIGRSTAFWQPLYPTLQAAFPDQLKDISLTTFIKAVNHVAPSLIRTEADELTYPLHIVIRYEIEKKIFSEDVDVNTLPQLWNDLYERYLGVRPPSDTLGILQDIHWADGMFGYFPTYALGSAIAAQIYCYLKEHAPLDTWLTSGNLQPLTNWLKENIHQYGCLKDTFAILKEAIGKDFDASVYVNYLKTKYEALYKIN